jgi:dienelactone hydrolase
MKFLLSLAILASRPFASAFTSAVATTTRRSISLHSHRFMDWSPLASGRLNVAPAELVTSVPQLAKDSDYAQAIQATWQAELRTQVTSESTPFLYHDANGKPCHGRLIRTCGMSSESKVPGVLFFHTGAGPHDVCLHWKADSLVTNSDLFPDGCVVLIADILGDDIGWAWHSDRTKYDSARREVLGLDANSVRSNLRTKIDAALKELKSLPGVNITRLAAMGWCLGGHSVLEIARMTPDGVKGMITFHGVFDDVPPKTTDFRTSTEHKCSILICNGAEDPFVSESSLKNAVATMERYGHEVTILQLKGAKHGFTNPAQEFNPNEAFKFNRGGAEKAWSSALDLLKATL